MSSDDKDRDLTPEEIEVNKIFSEASLQIEVYENQLKNLLPDKGPTPGLRPPGSIPIRPSGTKLERENELKANIERTTTAAKERAAKVIETSDPALQKKVGKTIKKWKDPEYKEKGEEKTIDQAQANLLESKELNANKREVQNKPPDATPEPPQSISMSARFQASLGFHRFEMNGPSVTPDQPSKDDPEPEIDPELE